MNILKKFALIISILSIAITPVFAKEVLSVEKSQSVPYIVDSLSLTIHNGETAYLVNTNTNTPFLFSKGDVIVAKLYLYPRYSIDVGWINSKNEAVKSIEYINYDSNNSNVVQIFEVPSTDEYKMFITNYNADIVALGKMEIISSASNLYSNISYSNENIKELKADKKVDIQINPMALPDIDPVTNPASDNWLTQQIAKKVNKDNTSDLTQEDFNKISDFYSIKSDINEIPKEIGNLFNLEGINLGSNQIEEIPKELFNLSKLEYLLLGDNQIKEIPKEINSLINLKTLYLNKNQISEIPIELFDLINLKNLNLSCNNLNSIPNEVSNLTNLTNLNCSYNQINEISEEISKLINLVEMYFNGNNIAEIPNGIGNLSNLKILEFSENKIAQLPKEIGNLTNLNQLNLNKNNISLIPKEIGHLSKLEELSIIFNQIKEVPEEISKLSSLKYLYLIGNQLTNLPKEIENLPNLVDLYLGYNNLSLINNLGNLRNLNLQNNLLTTIPISNSNLNSLRRLELSNNQIEEIPVEIDITNLYFLDLEDNCIKEVPNKFENLDNLRYLNLKNQTITLPSKSIVLNESFSIHNPIKIFDNYVMPQEISNQGTYDNNSNSITWLASDDKNEESFKFSEDIRVNYAETKFNGTVYQPLTIDNIDKKDKLQQSIKDAQAVLDGDTTTDKIIKAIYDLSKAIQDYNK